MASPKLTVTALGRAFGGADVSGDAWMHLPRAEGDRIVLVDGAGHGPMAADAASIALSYLRDNPGASLTSALQGCHDVLTHTRGAVITIADVGEASITCAGVGNVDGRILTPLRTMRFTPDRGLLGSTLPRIHPVTFDLPKNDWFMMLSSDGISLRMTLDWQELATPELREAYLERAMAEWSRPTDDATLVLVTPDLSSAD